MFAKDLFSSLCFIVNVADSLVYDRVYLHSPWRILWKFCDENIVVLRFAYTVIIQLLILVHECLGAICLSFLVGVALEKAVRM